MTTRHGLVLAVVSNFKVKLLFDTFTVFRSGTQHIFHHTQRSRTAEYDEICVVRRQTMQTKSTKSKWLEKTYFQFLNDLSTKGANFYRALHSHADTALKPLTITNNKFILTTQQSLY